MVNSDTLNSTTLESKLLSTTTIPTQSLQSATSHLSVTYLPSNSTIGTTLSPSVPLTATFTSSLQNPTSLPSVVPSQSNSTTGTILSPSLPPIAIFTSAFQNATSLIVPSPSNSATGSSRLYPSLPLTDTITNHLQSAISSPGVVPATGYVSTTSGDKQMGRSGILSNLKDAPLWVWVIVSLVILAFISCCIVMCSVAAYMSKSKEQAREKKMQRSQARERRRRSLKMKKIYGELEEASPSHKSKKRKSKTELDPESPLSRFGSFRMSWSRRSSRKTISTFKPQLSQTREISSSSTNFSDVTSSTQYGPVSPAMVTQNPTPIVCPTAPCNNGFSSSLNVPTCNNTAFQNPLFDQGREEQLQNEKSEYNAVPSSTNSPSTYW